jgi:hypothetical protein
MTKSDPTKDPEFQMVVQTFLHTKPQPHEPKKKKAAKKARGDADSPGSIAPDDRIHLISSLD